MVVNGINLKIIGKAKKKQALDSNPGNHWLIISKGTEQQPARIPAISPESGENMFR